MKKALTLTSAITGALALTLIATPASAQVLGGVLGGGGGGGMLDSTIGGIDRTVRSSTGGAFETRGSTRGNTRINPREGRVDADGGAEGSITGNATQVLNSPLGGSAADVSGQGNASANGSVSAQLVGTDAVRQTATGAVSTVHGTATGAVGTAHSTATGAVGTALETTTSVAGRARGAATGVAGSALGTANGVASASGSAAASVSGSANGAADGNPAGGALYSIGTGILAAEGSSAASGEGVFAIAPGMDVLSGNGDHIGEVSDIVADRHGQVSQVLVQSGDSQEMVPAGNLSGAGDALVMGEAEGQSNREAGPTRNTDGPNTSHK